MKQFAIAAAFLATVGLLASPASAQLISEIRIDESGADVDEYFELVGTPGASLAGLTYLVIGDGSGGCGTIECVVDLGTFSLQADGLLAVCKSATPVLTGYDVVGESAINFENSDNVTHMVVRDFTGSLNDDIDLDDDGVQDITPWSGVVDCVAMIEDAAPVCVGTSESVYCSTTVGPDGSFVPGHVYRCGTGWLIGAFQPTGTNDTPGEPNDCPTPVEDSTWGKIKTFHR